jgi:hypothetical protein
MEALPLLFVAGLVAVAALLLRRRNPGLAAVTRRGVRWQPRPVLNQSEAAIRRAALAAVRRLDPSLSVWPQVALGEIVCTPGRSRVERRAFGWVNAKRLDLLVADRRGWPLLAIEYQGAGHFRGDWKQRDAVKRAVLDAAGIPLVAVSAGAERHLPELEEQLIQAITAATHGRLRAA